MPKYVTIKMTRTDALRMGLLMCVCGHPPNNHFRWKKKPCARPGCPCERYAEIPRVGKFVDANKQ